MAFVTDTFTDSNGTPLTSHTGETGATWTSHGASAGIPTTQSNRLVPAAAECVQYASGTPASAEYDVEADVYASTTSGDAAVLARVSTSANTWYLAQYNSSGAAWRLYKRVSGTWTELGSFSQTLTAGNTYRLKLQIRDAAKKLFVDGVERISSADNAITAAGKAGIRFDGGTGTGLHLDNFQASDPVSRANMLSLLGVS